MIKSTHLVVFAGLALCLNIWAPAAQAQQSSLQASDPFSFPEFTDTEKSKILHAVNRLLERAAAENDDDLEYMMTLFIDAHSKLAPLLIDPYQDDLEVWHAAGRLALASYDDELAAITFEAIIRIEPDSKSNPRLSALMSKLAGRPIDEYVQVLEDQRASLAAAIAIARYPDKNEDPAPAMNHIGNSYSLGFGVAKNSTEAVRWYKLAAEAGLSEGMYNLALMHDNGEGVDEDNVLAATWYHKAADLGDTDAMYNLGLLYQEGEGVDQNSVEAAKWYTKAANLGDSDSMYNLALAYDTGEGIAEDDLMAIAWYTKAAKLGDSDSMYNLACMYDIGEGIEEDNPLALKWYHKAADAGDIEAMYNLGIMYEDGEGVDQNYNEAIRWYSQAASAGSMDAMFNIGVLYYNGTGVDEDHDKAVQWWTKAASMGEESSQTMLTRLGLVW